MSTQRKDLVTGQMHKLKKNGVALFVGCTVCFSYATAASAVDIDDIQRTEIATTAGSSASQNRIDELDDASKRLASEYRAVITQVSNLTEYNAQLERLVAAQADEMSAIAQQIEEVTTIDRKVVPLMHKMIDGLDQFVRLDRPFLISERDARIADLRQLMERSDASPAEKFRKILEAYEIENEYGRTIEAYSGVVPGDEDDRTVNFLRYGRVALVYQTFDQSESAVWDQKTRSWLALDSSFAGPIHEGIRIARQQVPPSLLVLPVYAAE
jgi:uncharacterized protein DUF3450